jgi:hypothetical protein
MTHPHDVVVLVEVDNTLLGSDRLERELRQHLDHSFGDARSAHCWEIFEALRTELGYADYLGALQQYRIEYPRDPHLNLDADLGSGLPRAHPGRALTGQGATLAPRAGVATAGRAAPERCSC